MVKVRDIIGNKDFDLNCKYRIWKGYHHDTGTLIYSGYGDPCGELPDEIMNAKITYMTICDGVLLMEVEE